MNIEGPHCHAITTIDRFIIVLLLFWGSGCHHTNNGSSKSEEKSISNIDTTAKFFEQYTREDSIEVIKQEHLIQNGSPMDRLIYIDYRWNNQEKQNAILHDDTIRQKIALNQFTCSDTVLGISNPFSNLNGTWCRVRKFKGKFILVAVAENEEDLYYTYTLTNRALVFQSMSGDDFFRYHAALKNANTTIYSCGTHQDSLHLEIKTSPQNADLQVWKIYWNTTGSPDTTYSYQLMMPLKNALKLPVIYSVNNIGLEDEIDITFDEMNEDSVFAKW